MGPSAPARFRPEWTPGSWESPLSDSTVPTAASTAQDRPGHRPAASTYRRSIGPGIRASPPDEGGAAPSAACTALPISVATDSPAAAGRTTGRRRAVNKRRFILSLYFMYLYLQSVRGV